VEKSEYYQFIFDKLEQMSFSDAIQIINRIVVKFIFEKMENLSERVKQSLRSLYAVNKQKLNDLVMKQSLTGLDFFKYVSLINYPVFTDLSQ